MLVAIFFRFCINGDDTVQNKLSLAFHSMARSSSRRQWWCWKIKVLQVRSFRSCFARSILGFLSRLSRGIWSPQFFSGWYFFDGSYNRLPSDVDKTIRWLFTEILELELVLQLMFVDYFNGFVHACSHGTAAQIKITGESTLLFIGPLFGTYTI